MTRRLTRRHLTRTIRSFSIAFAVVALAAACSSGSGDEADADTPDGPDSAAPTETTRSDETNGSSDEYPLIIDDVDPVDVGTGTLEFRGTTYRLLALGGGRTANECGPNINDPGILEANMLVVDDADAPLLDGQGIETTVLIALVHGDSVATNDLEFRLDEQYWDAGPDGIGAWSLSENALHATGTATVTNDDGASEEVDFSITCPA